MMSAAVSYFIILEESVRVFYLLFLFHHLHHHNAWSFFVFVSLLFILFIFSESMNRCTVYIEIITQEHRRRKIEELKTSLHVHAVHVERLSATRVYNSRVTVAKDAESSMRKKRSEKLEIWKWVGAGTIPFSLRHIDSLERATCFIIVPCCRHISDTVSLSLLLFLARSVSSLHSR